MKILHAEGREISEAHIREVAQSLHAGGVTVIPTDTCYGLAADPTNARAMEKLFAIKQRPSEKSVSLIFASIDQIKIWAKISSAQELILKKNLPGPFTFLLEPMRAYPLAGAVGARIPDFSFTARLSGVFGVPYTATSANISGNPSLYDSKEVEDIYTGAPVEPDLMLACGVLSPNAPSAVIDLRNDQIQIVRHSSYKLKR